MRDLKCPKCGHKLPMPTDRQIEAYRLTKIFQCTQEQAGKIMGITQDNVSRLLCRLRKKRPDLFQDKNPHIKSKKPFSFSEERDSKPVMNF